MARSTNAYNPPARGRGRPARQPAKTVTIDVAADKRERTVRVGNRRVSKAVQEIRRCGQLGRSYYGLTPTERKAIPAKLHQEVDKMAAALEDPKTMGDALDIFETEPA